MSDNTLFSLWRPSWVLWKDTSDDIEEYIPKDLDSINWGGGVNKVVLNLLSWDKLDNTPELIKNLEEWVNLISHRDDILKTFQDKLKTKEFLSKKGLSVTKWFLLEKFNNSKEAIGIIEKKIDYPVVIKDTVNLWWQWIYFVRNKGDFKKINFDNTVNYLVEEFVEWIEYSWSLLAYDLNSNDSFWKNITIFPPIEKWETWFNKDCSLKHSLTKIRTSIVEPRIEENIRELTHKIWQIEWVKWFLDIDFILDKKWILKIIEINPRVSWITPISLEAWNYDIIEIFDEIRKNPLMTNNLKTSNYIVEYPVLHKEKDFKETELLLPEWCNLKSKRNLRKYKPFVEIFLLKFDNKEQAKEFLFSNDSWNAI